MNKTLELTKADAIRLYPTADSTFKQMLELNFGKEVFSGKITDRIKTFEDACSELGINPAHFLNIEEAEGIMYDLKSIRAHAKLIIIARALNEGWKPNWTNSSEYKYYPWFDLSSGSGLSCDGYGGVYSISDVGSRLCFKSKELAQYAGKQFLDIYTEFFI